MSVTEVLGYIFRFIYSFTHDYGIAIVVFTVLIKAILLPFSFQQFHSMKKMSDIQPLIAKLQEKYKNDKDKLNQEIMKVYQENKVNPLGCGLPIIISFVILVPMYNLLRVYPEFKGVPFMWLPDLSRPDPTFILPVLTGITMYISSITATPPGAAQNTAQNKSMSIFMSIFFAWMTINFPSGLAVYWIVSNIFQIVQQLIFIRMLYKGIGEDAVAVSSVKKDSKGK